MDDRGRAVPQNGVNGGHNQLNNGGHHQLINGGHSFDNDHMFSNGGHHQQFRNGLAEVSFQNRYIFKFFRLSFFFFV